MLFDQDVQTLRFMVPSRKQFWYVFSAILILRLVVGLHFFSEGTSKVKGGNFSCAPFLKQAKGPFAEYFTGMLDDHDGHLRLCLTNGSLIDTGPTIAIWEHFVETSSSSARFDEEQNERARTVLKHSKDYLIRFFADNEAEIVAWAVAEDRLFGFARDGQYRQDVATQVESLRNQLQVIKSDRNAVAAAWLLEIETTWDELESRINQIADIQSAQDRLVLSRPYRQPWSRQDVIDRLLPWFDVGVGALLILGLFTRISAMAGVGLLLGVVATQPFWVLGVENTFNQWIEIAGLLVLTAMSAGRFGGVDYFLGGRKSGTAEEE